MRARLLLQIEHDYTQVEGLIEELRRHVKRNEDLKREVEHIRSSVEPARHYDMQATFAAADLSRDDWDAFEMKFVGDVDDVLARNHRKLEAQIKLTIEGPPDAPAALPVPQNYGDEPGYLATACLNTLRIQRDAMRKEVGVDEAQQRKYEVQQRAIQEMETSLRRLDAKIQLASGADERRQQLMDSRRVYYRKAIQTFVDEEAALAMLYAPLRERLEGATGAAQKLRLVINRNVDLRAWVEAGEKLLDLRSDSAFRGRGSLEKIATRDLLPAWSKGTADQVANALHAFLDANRDELLKARRSCSNDEEKRRWGQELATWLYSADHISIGYAITYNGTAIEQLSPGTRGIVLLLLFLVIDTADRRPLIVDQPEENLDPKSVFDELVPHFREARRNRQVIIVTHNANLVVNTDADQIIVANVEPAAAADTLPTISYWSGSLETRGVRTAVCSLLEGGERAFIERERRYRIERPNAEVARDDGAQR